MRRLAKRSVLLALGLLAGSLGFAAYESAQPEYTSGIVEGGALSPEEKARYHYATDVLPPSSEEFHASLSGTIETDEGLVGRIVTYSRAYDIDDYYEAMVGPKSSIVVDLGKLIGATDPELIWLKGISVEVVDERGEVLSNEYTCHLIASVNSAVEHDDSLGVVSEDTRFSGLAQGFYHKEYPRGFGLPVLSTDRLAYASQMLNYNTPIGDFPLRVRHRVVVQYIRDRDLKIPMKAITNTYAQGLVLLDGNKGDGYFGVRVPDVDVHGESCSVGVKAQSDTMLSVDYYGRRFSPHWLVGPGKSVSQTLVTNMMKIKYDTTMNVIDTHIHPMGEWVELRDLTTGETIFHADAEQRDGRLGVARVQTYQSEEGIPVYADHEYAVVTAYNNTRGIPTDAMAIFYIGLWDKLFDPALMHDKAARLRLRNERELAAIERRKRAVEEDPMDPAAHYYLGLALYERGDLGEAVDHLSTAVELQPENGKASKALDRARAALDRSSG